MNVQMCLKSHINFDASRSAIQAAATVPSSSTSADSAFASATTRTIIGSARPRIVDFLLRQVVVAEARGDADLLRDDRLAGERLGHVLQPRGDIDGDRRAR